MAEALAALGIACNVLAVVDFTWTLLTEAREIYKADTGASDNVIFLETIVNDIKDHDDRLARSGTDDESLQNLIEASRDIAAQLSAALTSMKRKGRVSKWKSFKAALKEVWGDDKVKDLAEKVGSIQNQIARHVLMSISDEVKETGSNVKALSFAIKRLERTNALLGIERKEDLNELEQNLAKVVRDAALITQKDLKQLCRAVIHEDSVMFMGSQRAGQILTAAKELSEAADLTQKDQDFLESLHFSNRMNRHYNIEDSHKKTFEWILQDDSPKGGDNTSGFKEWLERGDSVYWISGKPGSGKSTLMKFLSKNESTKQCLRVWACGEPLITANFYFWNAGTALQKSQEGLLRSIIFELLRNCPDLIPAARRAMSAEPSIAQYDRRWEVNDLLSMYTAVVTQDVDIKFCLFIDGLDEFKEPQRSQRDLLSTIRRLGCSSNIKLCLSSRPWTEFLDEFGNDGNHLKLEDLTRGDIERYVTDHFRSHPQFEVLSAQDVAYANFIQLVLDRAQGVFLWVYLMMRELLQGLTHHDSLVTLRRRLDRFPPDLEKFFMVLIDLIDPIYHKQMARYFYLATAAEQPLPGRYNSFLDDLEDNTAPVLDGSLDFMSAEEASRRENQLRRRLDGRTRGLLELKHTRTDSGIIRFWSCQVEFLHRTVRDFLHDSQEIQDLLLRELCDENTSLNACKAVLVSCKTVPKDYGDFISAVFTERKVDNKNLFLFASTALRIPGCGTALTKALLAAEEADNRIRQKCNWMLQPRYFLGMGAAVGFRSFLESNFRSRPQLFVSGGDSSDDHPLLYYALLRSNVISLECVTFLLEKGADPNENTHDEGFDSVWHELLRAVELEELVLEKRVLYNLLSLLISYDADFQVSDEDENTYSTVNVLSKVLDERMALQLYEQFLEKHPERKEAKSRFSENLGQITSPSERSLPLIPLFETSTSQPSEEIMSAPQGHALEGILLGLHQSSKDIVSASQNPPEEVAISIQGPDQEKRRSCKFFCWF